MYLLKTDGIFHIDANIAAIVSNAEHREVVRETVLHGHGAFLRGAEDGGVSNGEISTHVFPDRHSRAADTLGSTDERLDIQPINPNQPADASPDLLGESTAEEGRDAIR